MTTKNTGGPAFPVPLNPWESYQEQGTWSGSGEEIHSLDLGIEVYAALLSTTPIKTVKRAMERVKKRLKQNNQRD